MIGIGERGSRPTIDEMMLTIATVVSRRGTCLRRQVGCVLTDAQGRVIATGYNGGVRGEPHCGQPGSSCEGFRYATGTGLEVCEAIHAEQNALVTCPDPARLIHTCYVSVSPCVSCVKLLLNTCCVRIVFNRAYADHDASRALWTKASGLRVWLQKEVA